MTTAQKWCYGFHGNYGQRERESAPDWQINADPRFTIRRAGGSNIELLYCGKMRESWKIWMKIQMQSRPLKAV